MPSSVPTATLLTADGNHADTTSPIKCSLADANHAGMTGMRNANYTGAYIANTLTNHTGFTNTNTMNTSHACNRRLAGQQHKRTGKEA
jgi:hypothetical protein